MIKLSIHHSIFSLFLFLLHQLLFTIATPKPPYTPTDTILVNCGSSNDTSADGRHWIGDLDDSNNFNLMDDKSYSKLSSSAKAPVQDSSVESVPYMTTRISRSSFTYTFNVTPGQKFIRLYFYPVSYGPSFNRSKGFFDVRAGTFTFLRNFSASLYADAWEDPTVVKEYCLNVEENQQLNLTFTPTRSSTGNSNNSFAFINGIEIVSMPTNLYYSKSYVQNNTALEKISRLNVGGSSISPTLDTGMYRLWSDDGYYFQSDGVIPRDPSIPLNYSEIPQYTAPDDVYRSARSMGTNRTNNLLSNLTWVVPVDQGFRHLVRLHFCEIVSQVTDVDYRVFTILIDGQPAEVSFDVYKLTGGRGIPIYRDYILMTGKKGVEGDYMLYITLKANDSIYADAILNGLEVLKLNDSGGSLTAPNLAATVTPPAPGTGPVPPPLPTIKNSNSKKTLLIAVAGSVLVVLSLLTCIVIWRLRKKKYYGSYCENLFCCWSDHSYKGKSSKGSSMLPDELCRHFSLDEIKSATDNFHKELIIGVGGFGNVYKGYIDDDGAVVAVAIKRLNPGSGQGFHEFKTEIEMLSRLRHAHLVSLVGYCIDQGEMILVYEYISNGTLREHLYGTNNDPIPWKKRLEICIGAAKGFDYLHTGVTNKIIHRDVKTTNILLDENWVAKVADFGLSRIGMNDRTAVSTIVKGTLGYLDPEYARRQKLTEKSDVYSFGVVLFEVLCARKPINLNLPDEQWNLANWTRKCIQDGTIYQMIDPYLMGRISPECFNKFVEIAESCVRDQGHLRPSMHDVMENLEFALELQEDADAKVGKDPGGECVYPEASFRAPKYADLPGTSELDPSNASGLTSLDSDNTGLTFPSTESGSSIIRTSQAFSDSTNSSV